MDNKENVNVDKKLLEVFTFNGFVDSGRGTMTNNNKNNMPWHFSFKGYPVTHENNDCYLISIPGQTEMLRFNSNEVLLVLEGNEIQLMKKEEFEKKTFNLSPPIPVDLIVSGELETTHKLPEHQQRVIQEKKDLSEKIVKLDAFICSNPSWKMLSAEERIDLLKQCDIMKEYATILMRRISRF